MEQQIKQCQNCKKEFIIESDDFAFYEKIKVPAPTWCPECRLIRRLSFINSYSVFWRNCDKCGKRTLSMYPPSQKMTVYCNPCWWGDGWDGADYALEYNPTRPFLEQVKELAQKTPYCALEATHLTLENCDYCNAIAYSKNSTLIFWADYCENVSYSSILNGVKDTFDCLRIKESQLCYESIGQNKSYRVAYSQECDSCVDTWFSRNCYSCQNCVGCVNLRGGSYQIFNQKYTKEEYIRKLQELKLDTRSGIEKMKKEVEEFWRKFPYRCYTGNSFNLKTTGEYVFESKNSKEVYICSGAENCKWCQFVSVAPMRDSADYSGWGNGAELIYEGANIGDNANNVKFSYFCFPDILDTEYSFWCVSAKNNFGCVNLKRKQYAILNKVYEKEEYLALRDKIIENMKQAGEYGEFFPPSFSNIAYNTSNAHRFFPKIKDQAIKEGYSWSEEAEPDVKKPFWVKIYQTVLLT